MNPTAHTPNPASRPHTDPWDSGWLDVGHGHRVYYEQCGNPAGVPVVVLHGGPGSGCSARQRQLLDADGYRMVLFDQRGSGRSTPRGACADNTTAALVSDIERLRAYLGITRWLVSGGSWGSALAVAYCARHHAACLGAILRGIFLTGSDDIDWFFQGAATLRPAAWRQLAALVPEDRHGALASWYFETVAGPDRSRALEAVSHWMQWEAALTTPLAGAGEAPTPCAPGAADSPPPDESEQQMRLDKYRIQAHYLRNECFVGEEALLRLAATIPALPVAILHGCDDIICRPANAVKLARALTGARVRFVDGAGHNPFEAPMAAALSDAGGHFLAHGNFDAW